MTSHPTRVRGLKSELPPASRFSLNAAPHTGAWIEICSRSSWACSANVAPHTGAWIEINVNSQHLATKLVAPHTGAWIEIVKN